VANRVKYVIGIGVFFCGFFAYNSFLVKRDQKMFDAYYGTTPHERHCEHLKVWHPDCKVE